MRVYERMWESVGESAGRVQGRVLCSTQYGYCSPLPPFRPHSGPPTHLPARVVEKASPNDADISVVTKAHDHHALASDLEVVDGRLDKCDVAG